MRVIGGLIRHDPAEPLAPAALSDMMGRAGGGPTWTAHVRGSVGFFSSLGPRSLASSEGAWLVADTDLGNARELSRLGGEGDEPALLARLYEREGTAFLRRLRGAFALALWDPQQRQLVLAVDHFGIRRLAYAVHPGGIAFASRVTALRAATGSPSALDPAAIYAYLNFGYLPAPVTPFVGVHRLPPGHVLVVRDGQTRLERYWDVTYAPVPQSRHEAAVALDRVTEAAVAGALGGRTSKETGAFLSGGTDSSTVVGLMARVSGEKVNAFSIGFGEAAYNELEYAAIAARHFGATQYTRLVSAADALEVLPRLVDAYDEPFGNNSAIATYFCAQLASETGVRTLLAGDGGDEIFGGNERYTTDWIFNRYQLLPRVVRRALLEPVLRHVPREARHVLGRARRYVERANVPNPRRFYHSEFFFAREGERVLSPDFRAAVDPETPYAVLEEHYRHATASEELDRLLYLDLKLTIGDNDLLKVTRTCEVAGVEPRFPLLDPRLVELTATWPARFKVRGLEKRHLFRHAFRPLLPAETLAKRKHGFGVPTSAWMKKDRRFGDFVRDVLLAPRVRERGYFRDGAIAELLRLHAEDTTPYYGDILWTVLMLELWQRRHVDGTPPA
jgi:asparagine synthase (glutamine-hydrolysing)